MPFTTESFKQLVIKTFVLSRGALDHQKKIIDYIVTFYTPEDFNYVDYAKAFEEVKQKFNELSSKGNHAVVLSDPGITIGDAIRHFENSVKQLKDYTGDLHEKRSLLMLDLFMGVLERDSYYLSNSNEEARVSARKSDFRDKILKNEQSDSNDPVHEMWCDLHNYFENIIDKKVELSLKERKELFDSINKVLERWPNYFQEVPFFVDEELGSKLQKLADESKSEYYAEISDNK